MPEQSDDYALIADDLFAGAGGWDLGAAELGIHARGVEIMQEARETRDAVGLTTIHDDVWTFWPDGRATGKIASPPCPTFSSVGSGSGRRALDSVLCAIDDGAYRDLDQLREYPVSDDDDRTRLVLTPLHFATQHEYEWLAWEQVPAVLPVWEACAEVLRAQGWHVWTGKVNSEQYGVPQTRTRAVLIASRLHSVAAPDPTHSRYYSSNPARLDLGVSPWVSMADALGWEREGHMRSNYGTGGDPTKRGERLLSQPAPTVTSKIDRNFWVGPDWVFNRPSPTVVGSRRSSDGMLIGRQLDDGSRADVGGHQTDKGLRSGQLPGVRVTVGQAGVLQSFPANYSWQGVRTKQFLQCGNAVPPRMAMHVLAVAAGISIKEMAA